MGPDGAFAVESPVPVPGYYYASPGYFDVALDPSRARVYLSRGGDDEVEIVSLIDGQVVTVDMGNTTEHLYYDSVRDEVVVTLPLAAHSSSWDDADQEGCVGSIDADSSLVNGTWWIPLDPWDVVTNQATHAYVAGASGQWTSGIAVDLDSGAYQLHTGTSLRQGTNIDIHPNLDRIYGADNGLSPADIERYDVAGLAMTYAYDSPYHGDFPMCGDLRVAPDGATIHTACGHVFLATNVGMSDMTWTGDLGMAWDDLAFGPGTGVGFMAVQGSPVLFTFDAATLLPVGTYTVSAPVERIIAGPDYLVLVRTTLGGAPATELEVVPYSELLAPPAPGPGLVLDADPTVTPGTYQADPSVFDAVLDDERGRVFLSHGLTPEVEIVDLTAGVSGVVATPARAEHMHFDPIADAVAISLPVDDHSLYWFDEDQEGFVSTIDAVSLSLAEPRWIPRDPWQLVTAGTNYVYVAGGSGQWTDAVTVDMDTGWFSFHTGSSVRNGTNIRIHPNLDRIYGADNGLSPSDIERWDVLGSYLDNAYDSPYHGDFPMCGDLRIDPTGNVIYTRCGHVFIASNVQASDMTWTGDLGVTWQDLVLDPSGMTAYVIEDNSNDIGIYDTATLALVGTYALPSQPARLLAGPTYLVVLREAAATVEIDVVDYGSL